MNRPTIGLAVAALSALSAWSAAAQPVPQAALDEVYRALRAGRYGHGVTVPAGGLRITSDTATWTLIDGTVRPLAPLDDGRVTGLAFTGEGRFTMTVPDPVERVQLARVTGEDGRVALDEPFTALVVRGLDPLPAAWSLRAEPPFADSELAAERHEHYLEQRLFDVDARIAGGLGVPGDRFLLVDVSTERFGWLTYSYDGQRQEEIRLSRFDAGHRYLEHWLSLDRPEERDAGGRPASDHPHLFDLRHVELAVDLTRASRRLTGRRGVGKIVPRRARFRAELTLVPRRDGLRALPLVLDRWSEVAAVADAEGGDLAYLRDAIGARKASRDDDLYDDDLLVLLPAPLAAGRPYRLSVAWERDVANFVPDRAWYPGGTQAFHDRHTGRLRVTALKKHDVRATGVQVEDRLAGRERHLAWEVTRPTAAMSFVFTEKHWQARRAEAGVPEVVATTFRGPRELPRVADDVVASARYFQELLASPLELPALQVASIEGGHGQSFEGFIHLSLATFQSSYEGRGERFRAHEVAHQWFGHQVGWSSYRDQWLSEGFAELAAMLYIEARLDQGERYYDEIVRTYAGHLLGEIKPSRFERSWAMQRNDLHRRRIGPIELGYRASTAESRAGYVSQVYLKGALVLHMLRTLLRDESGGDQRFVELLRAFVRSHRGGRASTRSFIATLEAVTGRDWGWFFQQWVYDTAIPTYRWRHEIAPPPAGETGTMLHLAVVQEGVGPAFRMPVPVEIDYRDGRSERRVVVVDRPRQRFALALEATPSAVRFNPRLAVLARVEESAEPLPEPALPIGDR